jgi:UDP-N-acetylglucosamine 2-epimerase (non-hydrolysing)
MKLLLSFGTRPEYIKIKPLIDKIKENKIPLEVLFTGQQEDIAGGEFDKRIEIPRSDNNRLDSVVSSCLNDDWVYAGITHIMVQGDTSSALGMALGAFHRKIKVIHLEAGLRTYQRNPYPEEMNRQLIDVLSDIHLCPTADNALNLIKEGFEEKSIFITGNTGLDNLSGIRPSYNNEVIVTMHRRENHEKIGEWFKQINDLAREHKELRFILPIHPNPNVKKFQHLLMNVDVVEPMPYEQMIKKIAGCKFIITDSGGLQEEASYFNKKAIVCRDCTERGEVLNVHSFLCPDPESLPALFKNANDNCTPHKHYCPYYIEGGASDNIIDILKDKAFV